MERERGFRIKSWKLSIGNSPDWAKPGQDNWSRFQTQAVAARWGKALCGQAQYGNFEMRGDWSLPFGFGGL